MEPGAYLNGSESNGGSTGPCGGDMKGSKKIVIITDPNGAGETTFAAEFLPNEADCHASSSVDLIAAGLSSYTPERVAVRAARLMRAGIRRRVRLGESFAFKTTFIGRSYARHVPHLIGAGGVTARSSFCWHCPRLSWLWRVWRRAWPGATMPWRKMLCADDSRAACGTFMKSTNRSLTVGYLTTTPDRFRDCWKPETTPNEEDPRARIQRSRHFGVCHGTAAGYQTRSAVGATNRHAGIRRETRQDCRPGR